MKNKFVYLGGFLLLLFIGITFPKLTSAQQGCCSWHGGVCGCSNGRKVCCDGTFSPSCTCYSYSPPAVTPQFPTSTSATWTWIPNNNGSFSLNVALNDTNPTSYSAVLSKCKGCNPGPSTDFTSNDFNFFEIQAGTWYLNVKKLINGSWSNVVYWTVEIPEWYPPLITPAPTPRSTTEQSGGMGNKLISWLLLGGMGIITLVAAKSTIKKT